MWMPEHRHSSVLHAKEYAKISQLQKICHMQETHDVRHKKGRGEREDSVLLTANTMENHPINLDAKADILKAPNTVCWFVEPLESTDKLKYFLPGCKLIRAQEHMLFQQLSVGPKKLLTGLTRDRDEKNRSVVVERGLITTSLLH